MGRAEGSKIQLWMRYARVAVACTGFAGLIACAETPNIDTRGPNVLVIVADDLGFSDIGVLGGEIPTPNLDALAQDGVLMTNFHVAATCSPTRAMLMSGVDNHRAGLGNMGEFLSDSQRGKPGYEGHLNHQVRTLATTLREAGYATAMAGKWHLGTEPEERPHARGFDRTFALLEGSGSAWSDLSAAPLIGNRVHFTRNGQIVEREPGFAATLFVDELIEFIDDEREERPFFAYLAFQSVHWPHHAPDEFLEKARGRYDAGWRAVRQARLKRQRELKIFPPRTTASSMEEYVPKWSELSEAQRLDEAARMEAYAAMGMAMDFEIGRLLSHLRSIGELDNTLVLFVSDNGADPSQPERSPRGRPWYEARYPKTAPDELGRPGSFPSTGFAWARVSVTPLATHKGQPGEGGLRVPLIARLPGQVPASTTSASFGYATDLFPTILDAVGLDSNSGALPGTQEIQGSSLWGVMTGVRERAHLETESVGYELMGNSALFRGDFKLIRQHNKPWRLYNIAQDPGETSDLAAAQPRLYEEMIEGYRQYEEQMGVVPVPADYDVMGQLLKARSR